MNRWYISYGDKYNLKLPVHAVLKSAQEIKVTEDYAAH